MAISCFDRNENILHLHNRLAAIMLPAPILLRLHLSKPKPRTPNIYWHTREIRISVSVFANSSGV